MNNEEFNSSMRRILAFHSAPRTPEDKLDMQNYLTALYEAVHRMDAFTFERVCVELANNMSRGQKPMPSQFWAVYHRLKGEENTGRVDFCDSCNSTGWVYVHMVHAETGMENDFCIPCPKCRTRHPLKDAMPKPGWTIQEKTYLPHDAQMLEDAKRMGAKGARFILDMVERRQVKFHDDVILVLMERAGDTPKQSNPQAEAVLNALTIVKPVEKDEPIDWAKEAV